MMTARSMGRRTVIAAAMMLASTGRLEAQHLLVGNGQGQYQENTFGGAKWGTMTGFLTTAFGGQVTQLTDLGNTAQVLGYDRLWLDQRLFGALSAQEVSSVAAFIATGRRTVIMGENSLWDTSWNPQVLGLVGGALGANGCYFGNAAPSLTHPLTLGVGALYLPCAHEVTGGTSLFDFEFATLWGPNQNVLTIFDANPMDDDYIGLADNRQFSANIATWLAGGSTTTPEPSSLVLLGTGLVVGLAARRRRAR